MPQENGHQASYDVHTACTHAVPYASPPYNHLNCVPRCLVRYKRVPMVAERLIDLPIGGVDDMAVWAAWVWQRVARWLNDGSPPLPPPNVDSDDTESKWTRLFVRDLRKTPADRDCAERIAAFAPHTLFDAAASQQAPDTLVYTGPPELRACTQRVVDIFWSAVAPNLPPLARLHTQRPAQKPLPTPPTAAHADAVPTVVKIYTDGSPGGYSGRAVAAGDWDGDGTPDVAYSTYGVGEPGRPQVGKVTVHFGRQAPGQPPATQVLTGPMAHGRFGWAMATIDWNHDGVDDLAVSAPTSSWEDAPGHRHLTNTTPFIYNFGSVLIFLGSNATGTRQATPLAFAVNISTADPLTMLGDSLAVGDISGDGFPDLLVGAALSSFIVNTSLPEDQTIRRGVVFGFVSHSGGGGGGIGIPGGGDAVVGLDARKDADLVLEGPSAYGWFGRSMAVAHSLLFVGSPGYRGLNGTAGCLYGHPCPNPLLRLSPCAPHLQCAARVPTQPHLLRCAGTHIDCLCPLIRQ